MSGTYLANMLFLAVSGLGAAYLAVEAALQSVGKSICASDGCKVVAQYTRYGDLSILLPGVAALLVVFILVLRDLRAPSPGRSRLVNAILIAALSAEGFFVGYQLFWLSTLCIFCISVFGIFCVLGLLRIAAGHREVLAGFAAMSVLFALFALLLPAGGTPLPLDARYVLFYSPDCKHCAEIRKDLEERRIEVEHVLVREHAAALRNFGIVHVPTLLVNGPTEKIFLTGTEAIRRHLGCSAETKAPAKSSRTRSPRTQPTATTVPLELFPPAGAANPLFAPLPDDGLCKEDKKCD